MNQSELPFETGSSVVCFAKRNGLVRRRDPGRLLNSSEIRLFWHQLARSSIDAPTQTLLRLMLLTGRSKEHWATARWSEFDLARRYWVRRSMMLSRSVLEQLQALRNLTGPGARMLFPGLNLGSATFCSAIDQSLRDHQSAFTLGTLNSETLRLSALQHIAQIQRRLQNEQDALLRWGDNCAELVSDSAGRIVSLLANR